jgi:hypothetical protein
MKATHDEGRCDKMEGNSQQLKKRKKERKTHMVTEALHVVLMSGRVWQGNMKSKLGQHQQEKTEDSL